jgi:hypothetical protein
MVFTSSPLQPALTNSVQVPAQLADLGLPEGCTVQDVWSGWPLGPVGGELTPYVRRNGVMLYRLSPPRRASAR